MPLWNLAEKFATGVNSKKPKWQSYSKKNPTHFGLDHTPRVLLVGDIYLDLYPTPMYVTVWSIIQRDPLCFNEPSSIVPHTF